MILNIDKMCIGVRSSRFTGLILYYMYVRFSEPVIIVPKVVNFFDLKIKICPSTSPLIYSHCGNIYPVENTQIFKRAFTPK